MLLAWPAARVDAYVASTTNTSQKPLRWTASNCIMLRIDKAGSDDLKDGSDLAAVRASVEAWHKKIAGCSFLRFSLLEDADNATASFSKEGGNENTVNWVETGWKKVREHDPSAAGLTTVFFVDDPDSARDGKILDADIELNGENFAFSAGPAGVPGKTDVMNTVVHELGHVMGLDHPCDDGLRSPVPKDHLGKAIPKCFPSGKLTQEMRGVTMFNFANPAEVKKRSPESDDVLGICQTYPREQDPAVCAPADTGVSKGCSVAPATRSALPLPLLLLAFAGVAGLLRRRLR